MDQQEQMEFFFEIFDASLPRLGPGDDASTTKALQALFSEKPLRKDAPGSVKLRVLDIGCGNGAQTLQLAKHLDGTILAVDNHQPFLDELNRRAEAAGLSKKIQTCLKDMRDLTRDEGRFDLIWSEGALNLMGYAEGVLNPAGFRDGLALCHRLLTPSGLLAVTELCWLRPDPPSECQQFFSTAYPAMAAVDANLSLIKSCGFEVIGHFTLPESAWWEQYLHPQEERLRSFRERYAADQEKLDFVESVQMEIDIYRKHSSYYGYVFFLMQSC
jgi:cyclopropane fatty-acyl-phospholipid synthase-like methyltransferase